MVHLYGLIKNEGKDRLILEDNLLFSDLITACLHEMTINMTEAWKGGYDLVDTSLSPPRHR
jgi:hypothetical protein